MVSICLRALGALKVIVMLDKLETVAESAQPLILNHALLRNLFGSPSSGLLLLDQAFNILCIGEGLCRLLGYKANELFGKYINHIVAPNDWDSALLKLQGLRASKLTVSSSERQFTHKDGSLVWVIMSVSAMADAIAPSMPEFVLQVASIDKQKLAEKVAEEATTRWNFALDSAGQGVWDCHVKNKTWDFSLTWRQMRGIPADEVLITDDETWLNQIHPEDHKLVREKIAERHTATLDEVSFEYRHLHRNGYWIWILARGRVLERDEMGLPVRIIGTDTDVTKIRKREMELAVLSHRLELALSTSQVGVWKYDINTSKTYWDERCCEMFGIEYQIGPIPHEAWEKLLHPDDLEQSRQICLKGIVKRENYELNYRIVQDTGTIKYIRCRATFPTDVTDHNSVTGVMWDVTEDVERAEEFRSAKLLAENRSKDLEVARNHLEHASLHDSLTGLPNRRHLDNMLTKFQVGSKQGQSLTLLHIDLDRFKQINDTKGHAAGDAVLVQTAILLRTQFRDSDLVARIGGDEFVVLLSPAPDRRILQSMVDRVIQVSIKPIDWQGHECRCGVSIGVAESAGDIDPRQLLVNADIALYRAKRLGRNCAVHFTGSLQAEVIANKQCADDLLNGLEREEFVPYYQPIFNAKTRDVAGVEALVRWKHPKRGILGPDRFLSVASELNTMNAIDHTILEQALADLKYWDANGVNIPRVSVNVSARRLGNARLLESLQTLSIQPGRVSFELLESIFLDDADDLNTENIEGLKKLGINIDVDDFGTGHASIVGLLRLNPNRMKIDRQLIFNIVENESQRRLVRSLIEIGKSQNIEVCAEGVETAEHANILTRLGCDYLQGFYFAKPMPFESVEPFVKSGDWRKLPYAHELDQVAAQTLNRFIAKLGLAITR